MARIYAVQIALILLVATAEATTVPFNRQAGVSMAPLPRYSRCHDFIHFTFLQGNLPPRLQKKVGRAPGSVLCLPEGRPLCRKQSGVLFLRGFSCNFSRRFRWSSVSQAEITPPALLAASPSGPWVTHSRRFRSPGDAKTSTGGSGVRNRLTALGAVPWKVLTLLRPRQCLCPGLVVILRGPDDRRAAKVVALPLEFLNGVGRALIEGLETRVDNLSTVDLGHPGLVKQLEGLIRLVWHTLRVPKPRYGAHCGSRTKNLPS